MAEILTPNINWICLIVSQVFKCNKNYIYFRFKEILFEVHCMLMSRLFS